jgi:hypothetical protein
MSKRGLATRWWCYRQWNHRMRRATRASIYVYTDDVDAVHQRAVAAGASPL